MILNDELIDRAHRLSNAVLRLTAAGAAAVRSDALGTELGTGYALFAGEGSPLTQVVEFGHREPGDPAAIEDFFASRCANWEVSVNPFTDQATLRALLEMGYRSGHFEGVLAQTVGEVSEPDIEVVEVGDDLGDWMETTYRGWARIETGPAEPDELVKVVSAAKGRKYLAFLEGRPAATAALWEFEEGVVLGGAATRVPFRNRGLQAALIQRRLRDAGPGRFAMIGAVPGSQSYRNAQRAGFQPLFSKLILTRR